MDTREYVHIRFRSLLVDSRIVIRDNWKISRIESRCSILGASQRASEWVLKVEYIAKP